MEILCYKNEFLITPYLEHYILYIGKYRNNDWRKPGNFDKNYPLSHTMDDKLQTAFNLFRWIW